MRGLLLLMAGAGLIALGFLGDTEDGTRTAAAEPRPTPGTEARVMTADGEASTSLSGDEALTGPAPALEEPEAGTDEQAQPMQLVPAPAQPEAPAPAPQPESTSAGRADGPSQEPSAPVFELVGPGEDPVELGQTLLEAWIGRSPAVLGTYVNGVAKDTIPEGRRILVAAFWQAMAGDLERANATRASLMNRTDVTTAELALLDQALEPQAARAVGASRRRAGPLELAMRMCLLEERATRFEASGASAPARAADWSDLIHLELEAPWAPHREALASWAASLRTAQEGYRLSAGGAWPAHEVTVRSGDSLTHVRKRALKERPALVTCTGLIERVNGIKRYIHPDQVLRVPTDLPNVLVDLDARLVVYRHGEEAVLAWTCGIGKEGSDTPVGSYVVGEKLEEPTWYPPNGQPVPFGHPDNALGDRWIEWFVDGSKTSFGFHGTNDESGVGQRVSRGCIRLRNDDVCELFELLPVGARVVVQP